MAKRTNDKLAQLKEQMTVFMGSHGDAYANFDKSKVGRMSFLDFSYLVQELARTANQ